MFFSSHPILSMLIQHMAEPRRFLQVLVARAASDACHSARSHAE